MKKLIFLCLLILIGAFIIKNKAYAFNRREVLAASTTDTSQINFPSVSAGPGAILPDSPLFFLDQIFQQIKIAAAGTPEDKARVRAQIIGERMAELRIMLSKNDQNGIDAALNNLTNETNSAEKDLTNSAANGTNVEEAAKVLTEAIKQERDVLGSISDQAEGSLQLKIKSTREDVKLSKVKVEDKLPEELLQKEIEADLNDGIEDNASEVEDSTKEIETKIDALSEQASEAAKRSDKNRLETIQKAIENKNEQLKKQNELSLKVEKNKREVIKKQQEMLREKAKKAAEAAKELIEQAGQSSSDSTSSNSSSGNSESGSSSGGGSSSSGNSGSGGSGGSGSGSSGGSSGDSGGHGGGDDN